MGNPSSDDEKTTINVKGVNAGSWEQAKRAAHRAGDSMGAWLSRACDQLAKSESGDRLILPSNPGKEVGNPRQFVSMPEVDLHAVAAVVMALKEAGLPVQKRVGAQINNVLYAKLREGQGRLTAQDASRLISFTDEGNRSSDPAILVHEPAQAAD
jgi:hypothetical protein